MNKKGIGIIESILVICIATTALFFVASDRHKQQRIEKQQTAEGRLEYPMK